MGDKILFEIGSEKAVAELLRDRAPKLCKAIWDRLPIETTCHPAKVCNHELMIAVPFLVECEHHVMDIEPGDVGWWDERASINIWFDEPGPLGPLGPTTKFARIVRGLEAMRQVYETTWRKPGTRVTITRYE